jgi:hypothetical protein
VNLNSQKILFAAYDVEKFTFNFVIQTCTAEFKRPIAGVVASASYKK